jgi:queuine tRNA-ribosyltransferase
MKRKNKSRVANREGGAGGSSSLLSVSERGARFRSYHDGKEIELTPESSVEAQKALGADVIIPLVCDCH